MSEKDIENWLWNNPSAFHPFSQVDWLARQVEVPTGIIDLFGILDMEMSYLDLSSLVVCEVKNVPFKRENLVQVSRYQFDIRRILMRDKQFDGFRVEKFLIGPFRPDEKFLREAEALGVIVFVINDDGSIEDLWLSEENMERDNFMYDRLIGGSIFSRFRLLTQVDNLLQNERGKKWQNQ